MHFVTTVQIGSPAMVKSNIMARVTLDISSAEGKEPVLQVQDILIRKNQEGKLWIATPSKPRTREGKPVLGDNGKQIFDPIVKIGPKEKKGEGPIQSKFESMVLKKYEEALEKAKKTQEAQPVTPAAAPADVGEPEF